MSRTMKLTDMDWPGDNLWTYTLLSEPLLSSELARLSDAKQIGDTDCVSFQPCPDLDQRTQDRYVVSDWNLPNGIWKFRGVFDGHAGHETVDYVVDNLPDMIRSSLTSTIALAGNVDLDPSIVSNMLTAEISSLDDGIKDGLLRLFPDLGAITKLSDAEIRDVINDSDSGGKNSAMLMRCMRGTTVLLSLTDPSGSNLWVASLGDCQAVLGVKRSDGKWDASVTSSNHNGADKEEMERIRSEHPGEPECILDDRVLGSIAVTRAIGDHLFKLPAIYTTRVFMNSQPGFRFSTKVEEFLSRNVTPPYVSNHADIRHIDVKGIEGTEVRLIMSSDGLKDLYEDTGYDLDCLADVWVDVLAGDAVAGNKALYLLRDGLGGRDEKRVSRMITVEMGFRWMDDTTILVQQVL